MNNCTACGQAVNEEFDYSWLSHDGKDRLWRHRFRCPPPPLFDRIKDWIRERIDAIT